MVGEISPSKLYDFTNVIMWKLLTFLAIVSNSQFQFEGNRTVSDSLLQKYLGNCENSPDSILARKIIELYMNYGFPFVKVKIERKNYTKIVWIKEGPIVKLSGIVIRPEKYRNLISILPHIEGKTFSPQLIDKIKTRINSIHYIELKRLKFVQEKGGIFLFLDIREVYPPNSINSALSVTSRGVTGFLNVSVRNLYGRPISITTKYNLIKSTRELNIRIKLPYLFGSPFGVYGNYTNKIIDTTNYLTIGGGISYTSGGLEVFNGVERDYVNKKEEAILGRFLLKYSLSRLKAYLGLRYSKNDYRDLLKIGFKLRRFYIKLSQFSISPGLENLRPDMTNGLEFLRGYEYGSIEMKNGWALGVDFYLLKWVFLFGDYGKIQNVEYKSTGIGVWSNNGMMITYGIHPGIPWYDGILTISLKIAL